MKDDIFDNFLKRHSEKEARTLPRDLFQIVIFFFRPVVEELNFEKEEEAQKILKETIFFKRNKIKFALQNMSGLASQLLENQRFVFPFYSEDVFMTPKEAEDYIPRFIKKLIGQQKLPETVIKDNHIDYDTIETAIVPLNLATLERLDEFKNNEIKI